MITTIEHYLDRDSCGILCAGYDQNAHIAGIKDYSGFPVLHWSDFEHNRQITELLRALTVRCLAEIEQRYGHFGRIYPETIFLSKLGIGGCHPKHADNSRQDQAGNWIANHTPQRDVTALYYLNDDFNGGEIAFEQHGVAIKPRLGLLVIFPSDHHHVHEVHPVTGGERYSVQIWFTRQKKRALRGVVAVNFWEKLLARFSKSDTTSNLRPLTS
jgi:predicted 2-oxoglutarate/Fe(II)-dependent dioxygenase YbiX